ncbi:hypothetical protein CC86DRAFT_369330 [Ophiobolus disseminans]|uniref:Uncharacterized protein n=1 Tax=Ophiobolus disseminans TaxID=1469910 RepID=A0A6A7A6J0_9PLEO|nr:hypothetical protein CC86DRAFT_369330 [Ophiobolus disseminans]
MLASTTNGLKRKASSEMTVGGMCSPGTKKSKTAEQGDTVTHLLSHDGCISEEYEPERHDIAEILNAPSDSLRRPHRPLPTMTLDEKRRLSDEQVSLIILSRDNNKPNPYGQQSSTNGPLSWPAVADVYNQKFRVGQSSVGFAAMEKRARQNREAWMAARPAYPRKIVYTKKFKVVKRKVVRQAKPKQITQAAEPVRQQMANAQAKIEPIDSDIVPVPQGPAHSSRCVGGWVPPDDVRNTADIDNYIECRALVPDADQSRWMAIEVEDTDGEPLGDIFVPVEHICESFKCVAEQLEYNTSIRLKLTCHSKATVSRYVQCVSPTQLTTLPDWDIVSLMDLYAVAAQMEDDRVRGLVLERWEALLEHDLELELDPEDLNSIFYSTEPEDPAREFWAKALFVGGVAEQIAGLKDCHTALKAQLEELAAGKERIPPLGESFSSF